MKSSLIFLASLTLLLGASASANIKTASNCVIQLSKTDNEKMVPNFVIACGSETIMTHNYPSYTALPDKAAAHKELTLVLKKMMGDDVSITCREYDSELFFISICQR